MSARIHHDVAEQTKAVADAATVLDYRLEDLAAKAKAARPPLRGKRPKPVDLSELFGAFRAVERAEENYEIALHDLATASGADA